MKRSVLIFVTFISGLFSQNNVATTSAAFLEIGPGARSLGMGSAYVSVANDASSLYWNPAGIINRNSSEIKLMIQPWITKLNI